MIFGDSPLLRFQLILPELEGLVSGHGINGSAIFDCKAENIVCQVPTSDNVVREDV